MPPCSHKGINILDLASEHVYRSQLRLRISDVLPYLGPAGLFKQDVAFRDRTGPRKRNLLRASRLGRIDKVRPIRQNMPIW